MYFSDLYNDILSHNNAIIHGSGAEMLETIRAITFQIIGTESPGLSELHIIDPRRAEMLDFSRAEMVASYAGTPAEISEELDTLEKEIERRTDSIINFGGCMGKALYIVITDLSGITDPKSRKRLASLVNVSEKLNMYIYAGTLSAARVDLPAVILNRFNCRLCLKTSTKNDSILFIGEPGAELLPAGKAVYRVPEEIYTDVVKLPDPPTRDEIMDALPVKAITANNCNVHIETKKIAVKKKSFLQRLFSSVYIPGVL